MEVTLEQIHLASHIAIRHLQPETVYVHRPFKIHLKIRVMNITWGSQCNYMQCNASIVRRLMMEAVSEHWT
jgi:hypothetical protein